VPEILLGHTSQGRPTDSQRNLPD